MKTGENIAVIEERYASEFFFPKLELDTALSYENGVSGFRLNYFLDNHGGFPKDFSEVFKNCNLYRIALQIQKNGRNVIVADTGDFLNIPDTVISITIKNPRIKNAYIFIPARKLDLPKGVHELDFTLTTYPTSESPEIPGFSDNSNQPDIFIRFSAKLKVPEVAEGRLWVRHLALDETKIDASNSDFRLFGTGYPDLYWSLSVGTEVVYTSPIFRNSLEISIPTISNKFRVAANDWLMLSVADHDDISADDYFDNIKGRIIYISRDSLHPTIVRSDVIKRLEVAFVK